MLFIGHHWSFSPTTRSALWAARSTVRFIEPSRSEEPPAHRITLAVSPPKGDRMSWMVEKLSELGADALVPTVFQRSIDAGVRVATAKAERWRRTAVEAAKQCGRNFLLEVKVPFPLDGLLKDSERFDLGIVLIPEHPGAPSPHGGPERVSTLDGVVRSLKAVPAETLVLVGPEGGISPEESERIREAGFRPASLGSRILRIETAALAAAAVLRSAWD